MRNLIVLALCLSPALAFVPSSIQRVTRVNAEPKDSSSEAMDLDLEQMQEMFDAAAEADEDVAGPTLSEFSKMSDPAPATKTLSANSVAIPIMPRPPLLDGTLAGDVGFDPLGFADSKENLQFYADAEIKHARLAMLCAAGWPLSELWHPGLAQFVGADPLLASGGRAPSVLNGGIFTQFNGLLGLGLLIAVASAIELSGPKKTDGTGWGDVSADGLRTPGDFGFDPLGLYRGYGGNDAAKKAMRTAEVKNGRTAMMAVLMYVIEEASSGKPVTELTPWFFKPFWEVVLQAMGAAPSGGDLAALDGMY